MNEFLVAVLFVGRVATFFGVPHLPSRPSPTTSTWITNVDFLVHLHKLVKQVLPFRSLDTFGDGLTMCVPVLLHQWRPLSAGKERNVPSSSALSVSSSTPSRTAAFWHISVAELGLDHFDRLRFLVQIANLHRHVVVHLDKPRSFNREFEPWLVLQTFEDRVHQVVSVRFNLDSSLRAHVRLSHRP